MNDRPAPAWPRIALPAILALAIGLRVGALWNAPPLNIDECRYLVTAHHLRSGQGYADWRGPEIDIHPLHPALVATLGTRPQTLETRGRAVSFVASILLLWPLGLIARRIGGPVASALFLFLAAVNPWLARAGAAAQPESLYDATVAGGLVALLPVAGGLPGLAGWGVAGLMFGLAYLARPEGILVGGLAGAVALGFGGGDRRRPIVGAGIFVVALLSVCSPYLVFLERHTGGLTLTGKTAEIFFIGRIMHDAGGAPAEADAYLRLIEQWGGVLPFVVANPGPVLAWAGRNALQIGMSVLPRGLGPAGLLGLAAVIILFPREDRKCLRATGLLLAPCLSLGLMLFTFTNLHVIGSVVPFLLVPAALGLAILWERLAWFHRGQRPLLAGMVLVALALVPWAPAAWRSLEGKGVPATDREAARVALAFAGDGSRVATNNPALSFYVGDPVLFGPPGRYRPLSRNATCPELVAEMRSREATLAVLNEAARVPDIGAGPDVCPLRLVGSLDSPDGGRQVRFFALP